MEVRTAEKRNLRASGDAYEPYVGRWSRVVAREFLSWLEVPPGKDWLDDGCGTGTLSSAADWAGRFYLAHRKSMGCEGHRMIHNKDRR